MDAGNNYLHLSLLSSVENLCLIVPLHPEYVGPEENLLVFSFGSTRSNAVEPSKFHLGG